MNNYYMFEELEFVHETQVIRHFIGHGAVVEDELRVGQRSDHEGLDLHKSVNFMLKAVSQEMYRHGISQAEGRIKRGPKVKLWKTLTFQGRGRGRGKTCRGDPDVARKLEGKLVQHQFLNLDRGTIQQCQRYQIKYSGKSHNQICQFRVYL